MTDHETALFNKLVEDVCSLSTDMTKVEKDIQHITFRVDAIANVRMWIITGGAIVAGCAGLITLIEKITG